jgi:hypothetical protein
MILILNIFQYLNICRFQSPHGLRRRTAAARLLRSWVRIPSVCCECCVLSGRGLCNEVITRPEESYRLWCVFVCDLEISRMRRPWPALGRSATKKKKLKYLRRRFQWPCILSTDSTADCLLGFLVLNPPGAWIFVSVTVQFCQVQVSATGRPLSIQRSRTECDASNRVWQRNLIQEV